MAPVSKILPLCLICQASKSGNGLVKEEHWGPVWLQRSWETRTELARGRHSDIDLVAHKSQTLVRPPHGKKISLDCRAEEKDPGEDEGVEGRGGGTR